MQANYSEAYLLTLISKFRKRQKIRRRSFKSSKKRETRHFHVVVMQRRQRHVQKSMLHVQSCYFFPVADADAVVASLNVMLHETIRNDDFQHNTVFKWWNNVAAFETMSQQCY